MGTGGAPVVVDLVRDGPHALVAGTTPFLREVSFMSQATTATGILALVAIWETVSLRWGWIKAR